jgi:hypothetical protein
VGLVNDGIELFTRHAPELPVELGGIICRMLIDRNVNVRFGGVTLRVGRGATLHLITGEGDTAWESPVQVSDPANATATALKLAGKSLKHIRATAVAEWGDSRT